MTGRVLASQTLKEIQDHTLEVLPESWVDNTLSCFKSLKTPDKQTKPTHPLKVGGRA